jgi:thioredoxin
VSGLINLTFIENLQYHSLTLSIMRFFTLLSLALLLLSSWSQNQTNSAESSFQLLDAPAFSNALAEHSDAVLIDVRTAPEFEEGHIKNAQNLELNSTSFNEFLGKSDKKTPIYVYCLSGGRSSSAVSAFQEAGFENIVELKSGMLNWRANQLPEERGAGDKTPSQSAMSLFDFNQAVAKAPLVLVDFNATWCAPCKKIDVILQQISKEYGDKVTIIKIDIDQHQQLAQELKIASIPLLKIYKNGKLTWDQLGLTDKATIEQALGLK